MENIALEGEYQVEENRHTGNGGGAKGKAIVGDFKKAQERFRAYGLMEYGIDPVEEIKVSNDGLNVNYEPRKF